MNEVMQFTAAILKMHEDDYITQIKQGHISVEEHIHILFIGVKIAFFCCSQ